jgi:DNA mismatch repair ATPase MutS
MDDKTLTDLQIFGPPGRRSLFDLLDFTITDGGRGMLRKKFLHPLAARDDIEDTQHLIRYFAPNIERFERYFFRGQLNDIEYYLKSNITPLKYRNRLQALRKGFSSRLRYKSDYYRLNSCIRQLILLLQRLNLFLSEVSLPGMPLLVKDFFAELHSLFTGEAGSMILKRGNEWVMRPQELCYLDDFFRRKNKDHVCSLLNRLYQMDMLLSMAKAVEKYKLVFPAFAPKGSRVCFKGLYHLCLPEGKRNDFKFDDGKNVMLMTGPNMSGKSTYLKACGVAVVLAHMGMGVPADSATLPVFDDVVTAFSATDDIEKGYSYFYGEMNRMADVGKLLREKKDIFVVVDEMFKGTNFSDALHCSQLILEKLLLWKNSFFLLSTHIPELAVNFSGRIRCSYFEATLNQGEPCFTYSIKEGISRERFGLILLQQSHLRQLLTPGEKGFSAG